MPPIKIEYPHFMELSSVTTDSFWKQRFSEYATGKLPRSCQIKPGGKHFLVWQTKRGKTSSYTSFDISDTDKQKLMHDIIECFHKELDIYSPTEKENQEVLLELLLNPPKDDDSKPIKIRPMDRITGYVQRISTVHNLMKMEVINIY